jgi:hypothetical protein
MKTTLLAAILLMLALSPLLGQDPALAFLSNIPEFRDLSLKISEDQLKSHIKQHHLYARIEQHKERTTYWLLTPTGENLFVTFVTGKCMGIQRMQPIPKKLIEDEIGVSEFRAWIGSVR